MVLRHALGTITVFASGNKAEITQVQKQDGKAITDAVRARHWRPDFAVSAATLGSRAHPDRD